MKLRDSYKRICQGSFLPVLMAASQQKTICVWRARCATLWWGLCPFTGPFPERLLQPRCAWRSRQLPMQGAPALARIHWRVWWFCSSFSLGSNSTFLWNHILLLNPLRSTRILTGRRPLLVFGDGAESVEWALLGPALGMCSSPVCQRSLLQLCSWGAFRVVIFEH